MTRDFGHWFAGFLDGEGCFTIRARKTRQHYELACAITLRADDVEVLREIQSRTGLGRIRFKSHSRGPQSLQAAWEVTRKGECVALVALLDEYPLRAKKRRDYAIWREAVLLWARARARGNDWSAIEALRQQLMALRAFEGTLNEDPSETFQLALLERSANE